jgi:sortase A
MRAARIVGAIGRTLIGIGLLLLLFVAYQLWGTSIQEARAQSRLGDQFDAALSSTTTTEAPHSQPAGVTTTTVEAPPPPVAGDAIAQIRIPKIGVSRYVVEGVGVPDLKKAPGHYPQTPMPGQLGNAAIAGHRTTYGQPFYRLNELEPGDEIEVKTLQGDFTYVVDRSTVVSPSQTEVLDQTPDEARLTLTTCEPRFSARKRLVVSAVLEESAEPAPSTVSTSEPSSHDDPSIDVGDIPADVLGEAGLSGDPTARTPTLWWGLLTALVGVATWAAAKRWRRLWAYVVGAPIFFVLLFVFFENVSRLLPANI